MNKHIKTFYDHQFLKTDIKHPTLSEDHSLGKELIEIIDKYQLRDKRCLEIGCGFGAFQDIVEDYTGVDISDSVEEHLHKPFYRSCCTALPFDDNEFDVIWTVAVLEHVPDPEKALIEMRRVLQPNGLLLLRPAWYCRSWAAMGYPVRPYSDFNLKGKLTKASIIFRNHVLFRSLYILPRRLFRLLHALFMKRPLEFKYKTLEPNLEKFWMSDADAVNSMDPYEAILWFTSRGDKCLNFPDILSQFFVRTGPLIFRIKKH